MNRPARGCVLGLVLSLALWGVVLWMLWGR